MITLLRFWLILMQSVAWAIILLTVSSTVLAQGHEPDQLRFRNHVLSGQIFDVRQGVFLSETALLEHLQRHRLVLVGERHDNKDHHQVKRRILEHLTADGTRVVFEMLDESQQPLVASLQASDSLETIRKKLQWPDNQWPWSDYGPQIYAVLKRKGTLLSGNLDRNRVNALYGGDDTGLDSDPRFASLRALDQTQRSVILDQLYISHCETIPRDALHPMLTIQIARDSLMAYAMLRDTEGALPTQSILVAGNFHTRRDLGVPAHLAFRSSQVDATIVRLQEVDPGLTDPHDYDMATTEITDYLWFTPAAPEQNYCAQFHAQATSD